jgi:AcrR family transcriptional regulator
MRADALRNRARVLAAAETVLARDGLDAPMRAIARQAGVGVGTIYRQYPTKEALYQAIMADRMQRLAARAGTLAGAADPAEAFFAFFTGIVEDATAKKIFADALEQSGTDAKAAEPDAAHEVLRAIEALLTRAQQAGAVREDAGMPELLGLLAGACLAARQQHWDEPLRTRTLRIIFDGLRRQP